MLGRATVGSLLIVSSAAMGFGTICLTDDFYPSWCCRAPVTTCNDDLGHVWTCDGTASGGCSVSTVHVSRHLEGGKPDLSSTPICTCTQVFYSCGGTLNTCVAGSPVISTCVSAHATGEPSCQGP